MKKFYLIVLSIIVAGCGQKTASGPDGLANLPGNSDTLGSVNQEAVVVKSRALIQISSSTNSSSQNFHTLSLGTSFPISVTNSPSSSLTVDNSLFSIPTITTDLLEFGYLQISKLNDNNLKVCGSGGHQKCSSAIIRAYTTGAGGAGLYNSIDGYGAPITAGQSALSTVGLNLAGAITLQSFTIPSNRNVIHLSDFTNPKYLVKADFSNAGAGSYATTLVIEYGLVE